VPAGTAAGEASIPLNGPGAPTSASIAVTAPSGDVKTYTITVNRAAPSSDDNLKALTVTGGPLVPDFDPSITTYTMDVSFFIDNVTVTATKSDLNSVMLIGSVTVPAGTESGQETFPLNGPGTSTPISIMVTAQNGVNQKQYTITVNRALLPFP
jgi:hypothetical protein